MNTPTKILVVTAIVALLGVGVWYGLVQGQQGTAPTGRTPSNLRIPKSPLEFFVLGQNQVDPTAYQHSTRTGLEFMLSDQYSVKDNTTSIAITDQSGNVVAAIRTHFGPADLQDTNFTPLASAFGDSIFEFPDYANGPNPNIETLPDRIEGKLGSKDLLCLQRGDVFRCVVREEEKTVTVASDRYLQGETKAVLSGLVPSLRIFEPTNELVVINKKWNDVIEKAKETSPISFAGLRLLIPDYFHQEKDGKSLLLSVPGFEGGENPYFAMNVESKSVKQLVSEIENNQTQFTKIYEWKKYTFNNIKWTMIRETTDIGLDRTFWISQPKQTVMVEYSQSRLDEVFDEIVKSATVLK